MNENFPGAYFLTDRVNSYLIMFIIRYSLVLLWKFPDPGTYKNNKLMYKIIQYTVFSIYFFPRYMYM